MLEKEVESPVCKYAEARGCIVLKLDGQMNRGKPDRLFFYRGRVLIVEFKAPGKQPTELQRSWLEKFNANGFTTHVVDGIGQGKTHIDEFIERTDAEQTTDPLFDDL